MSNSLTSVARGTCFFFVLITGVSCDPEQVTKKGVIDLSVNLSHNAALLGKLTIDNAYLDLAELEFRGDTPDGNLFTFSHNISPENSTIDLSNQNNTPFSVEATQGTYDPFQLILTLVQDNYQVIYDNPADTIDTSDDGIANISSLNFTDYLQHARPGLTLSGRYDNRGRDILVYVAVNPTGKLTVQGRQQDSPVVNITSQNRAKVSIDPAYLFNDILSSKIETADRVLYQDQEIIFIHSQFNKRLYKSIQKRLEEPNQATLLQVIEIKQNN